MDLGAGGWVLWAPMDSVSGCGLSVGLDYADFDLDFDAGAQAIDDRDQTVEGEPG